MSSKKIPLSVGLISMPNVFVSILSCRVSVCAEAGTTQAMTAIIACTTIMMCSVSRLKIYFILMIKMVLGYKSRAKRTL